MKDNMFLSKYKANLGSFEWKLNFAEQAESKGKTKILLNVLIESK